MFWQSSREQRQRILSSLGYFSSLFSHIILTLLPQGEGAQALSFLCTTGFLGLSTQISNRENISSLSTLPTITLSMFFHWLFELVLSFFFFPSFFFPEFIFLVHLLTVGSSEPSATTTNLKIKVFSIQPNEEQADFWPPPGEGATWAG